MIFRLITEAALRTP